MTNLHFDHLLMPDGWRADVSLTIANGIITAIEEGRNREAEHHRIGLPGMPNLHSHAFQRAMSGFAETSGFERDSFWTWREVMYRFALQMSPEDVEAVAAQLYVEMLEAGFTRVGEFHYLHHDLDGHPYANVAEMAERIAAAAAETGLNLTLLPVFYRHGGFGGAPAQPMQRRFINDPRSFAALFQSSGKAIAGLDGANLGLAPHSLRAVTPADLTSVLPLAAKSPVHIHVAEQVKEVEDCLAWSGLRPVEWLLNNAPVDARWCLIHATHTTEREITEMADRGAIAGLCPITEANLGDGIYPAPAFVARKGNFGVGTDSNVSVGVADELRQLEYSQRLSMRRRNVLARPGGSTGLDLYQGSVKGGSRALGQHLAGIAPGAAADIVSLDPDAAPVAGHRCDTLLDVLIFGHKPLLDCVWTRGIKRVASGRHACRSSIADRYNQTLKRLHG